MASQKTFTNMKSNIGNEIGDTSSSFATIIGNKLNERYEDVIDRLVNSDLFEINRSVTATTTANVRTNPLPYDFGTIIECVNESSNLPLDVITEQEYIQRYGKNFNTTGTPFAIVEQQEASVRIQPSGSVTLDCISSSASDTTQSVFVRGISGSAEFYETVALSGTSTASTTNSYDYLLQVGKSATTTGKITIVYSDGVNVADLSPQIVSQRYKSASWVWMPSGSFDMAIRYKREVMPMVDDSDRPIIDIADIIEIGGTADAWRKKRFFQFASDWETLYERKLDRYINQRMANKVHQFQPIPYDRGETY